MLVGVSVYKHNKPHFLARLLGDHWCVCMIGDMTDDMALDIIVDEALRAADYTDKTSNYGMMGTQEVASPSPADQPPSSLTPINLEQVVSEIFRDLEVIDSTAAATIPCCTTSRLIGGAERLVLSAGTCISLDDGSRFGSKIVQNPFRQML